MTIYSEGWQLPLFGGPEPEQGANGPAPGFGCSIDNGAGQVLSRVWHSPPGESNAPGLAGLVASGTRWLQRQSIDKGASEGLRPGMHPLPSSCWSVAE